MFDVLITRWVQEFNCVRYKVTVTTAHTTKEELDRTKDLVAKSLGLKHVCGGGKGYMMIHKKPLVS